MESEIPRESETIAVRRTARLEEKLKKAREAITIKVEWWNSRPFEILLLLFVLALNFYLVYPFMAENSPGSFFSGPIIPLISKAVGVFGPSTLYAIQIVSMVFFLAFPHALYSFVKYLTTRKMVAIFAVLVASLPIYPFASTRIMGFLTGADTAHVTSLAMVLVALHGCLRFLRNGKVRNLLVASVSAGFVALISPFGFMTFVIFFIVLTFSEVLLGGGRLKFFRFLAILLVAGGLNSFWYNPGFFIWMITGPMGESLRHTIWRLIPIGLFTVPVLGTLGYLLFDRKENMQPLFVAIFFTLIFAIISLAGGGIFPSHPTRYVPEFGISLALLIAVFLIKSLEFLRDNLHFEFRGFKISKVLSLVVIIPLAGLLTFGVFYGRTTLMDYKYNVLGVWDDINKGEIWRQKEDFKGISHILGYVITVLTLTGLGIVVRKSETLPTNINHG